MLDAVLVQLYWISFAVIGGWILLLLKKYSERHKLNLIRNISKLHPLITYLLFICTGLVTLALVILPSYIFNFPLLIPLITYVFLLFCSLVSLYIKRKQLIFWLKQNLKTDTDKLYTYIPFAFAIIFGLIVLLKFGNPVWADSRQYLAFVTHITQTKHLTLADPYYGKNGILNLDYSANLIFAVESVAANLLHISSEKVWILSGAFSLTTIWLSFFTLGWVFLKNTIFQVWSYFMIAVFPFVYWNYFYFSQTPAILAFAWTCLFISGLKIYLESGESWLLIVSTILICLTHPLTAVIAALFLYLYILFTVLAKAISRKKEYLLMSLAILLTLPEKIAVNFQGDINKNKTLFNFTAPTTYQHYGPFTLTKIPTIYFGLAITAAYILVLFYLIYLRNHIKHKSLRLAMHLFVTFDVIFGFIGTYLSLIAFTYLLIISKNRAIKILIILLMLFYPIIAFNPVALALIRSHIPLWVIARIKDFNLLIFLTPLIGLYIILVIPLLDWGYTKIATIYNYLIPIAILLMPFFFGSLYYATHSVSIIADPATAQRNQRNLNNKLIKLDNYLRNQTIYTNNQLLDFSVPSIIDSNVIDMKGVGAPMANNNLRAECGKVLKQTLKASDLKSAKVSTLLIDDSIQGGEELNYLAKSKTYLKFQAKEDHFNVYHVMPTKLSSISKSSKCNIPYRQ